MLFRQENFLKNMKNASVKEKPLLQTAFEILIKELGPQKTTQLWRILGISKIDYLKIRDKLFKGKSLTKLYQEAKKFNR